MTGCAIDASVAVKWYLPEEHSTEAHRLLTSTTILCAPDLLLAEMGNVFWKRVRRGEIPAGKFAECLRAMRYVPLEIVPSTEIIEKALALAVETGRTVYDCLYLATAIQRGVKLVTADRKFYDALKGGPYGSHLLRVEDLA